MSYGWDCPISMRSGASCFELGRSTLMFLTTSGKRYPGGEPGFWTAKRQKARSTPDVRGRRPVRHDRLANRWMARFFVHWRPRWAVVACLAWAQDEDYDPAAAYFYSLLSFGAMQVIAPAIFGDFQSPVAVSYTPQWSGIMLQDAGFDTAVSTMLNGVVQQDLLPTGGALIAEEFGISASPDSASDGDVPPPSANGSDFSVSVPTVTGDASDPAIDAGGIEPTCVEDEV